MHVESSKEENAPAAVVSVSVCSRSKVEKYVPISMKERRNEVWYMHFHFICFFT